ncbi:hypothetical protein PFISCL1PPCAC_29075, partial [Pristionchus fissidentatus]
RFPHGQSSRNPLYTQRTDVLCPIVSGLFNSIPLVFPLGRSKIVLSPSPSSSGVPLVYPRLYLGRALDSDWRKYESSPSSLMQPTRELYDVCLPRAPLKQTNIFKDELSITIDRY